MTTIAQRLRELADDYDKTELLVIRRVSKLRHDVHRNRHKRKSTMENPHMRYEVQLRAQGAVQAYDTVLRLLEGVL